MKKEDWPQLELPESIKDDLAFMEWVLNKRKRESMITKENYEKGIGKKVN